MKLRKKIYEVIFEADTPAGKAFDVVLLITIVLSVLVVSLDSVDSLSKEYRFYFTLLEWIFTFLFSVEYLLRLYSVKKPLKYAFSFFGIIDFMAVIPTYLSLIFVGSHYLIVIRTLWLLRVFRVLKLVRYVGAAQSLEIAFNRSKAKIIVFLEVVLTLVVIIGAIMYLVEGPQNGFTSIPKSIYWAIVTVTTVGYGDVAPQTVLGQSLASLLMIVGYAIIAVPTGIITAETMLNSEKKKIRYNTQICQNCQYDRHDDDAQFCKMCGEKLN
ncbi:MAG: ion transporter [Bacteroidales bacterium]|nr:ion transporter [Bacteroidales bacterium]